MKKLLFAAAVAGVLGLPMSAAADTGFGVGAKLSTLGGGVELGASLNDSFSARLGLNKYDKDDDQTIDGIHYNAELELSSTALYLDWHPMNKVPFRLSAGYLFSNNELNTSATPASSVEIGGNTYAPGDVGKINGNVAFGDGPYVGVGWGNVPAKGFGFTFDLGVVAMGEPDVELDIDDPNGVIAANNDIEKEEANMEEDLDEFDTYPVISLGLSYGF